MVAIESDLAAIKGMLEEIRATMVRTESTVSNVMGQVMPTVEALTKSPMLKMLGLGK